MNTTIARVLRVLTGHSATSMIHAVDERGHELKLEVPTELTRTVAPGRLLVFQWSVHGLPETASESAGIEVVQVTDVTPAPAAASPSALQARPLASATGDTESTSRLEELLGLRPGRLRGASDVP